MNKLQKVWNDLDKVYEHMENAIGRKSSFLVEWKGED